VSESLRGRDFLALSDLTPSEFALVLDTASEQKRAWKAGIRSTPLSGMAVAIILQKPSLRTRVSFEVACGRLGAQPVVMSGAESAFSRGESIHDTAKVLERYCDGIVLRTYAQATVEELALHASVPVVNALTDEHHPCQGLADFLTMKEHFGQIVGLKLAYVGDGNNMAHTYLLGGALGGCDVRIATPEGYEPDPAVVKRANVIALATGARIQVGHDPSVAVSGADVVATDTWASMGQEGEHVERVEAFAPFTCDISLMDVASPSAKFMHCLPAHRGEEVTDEVIDSPSSIVFDEAENRLHAQKALLSLLLTREAGA
jgi:ornithine carbamoyltransferase